jgi:uncharacterized protein YdaU (DUF1376 family)
VAFCEAGVNFYPHHIGDYISHTAHLSNDEDLAYRRLIELYYQGEGPITHDIAAAARAIRMRDQKDAVESVLKEFFVSTADGYRHGRCDDEIAKYHSQIEAGKRGAAKRWGEHKDRVPMATPMTPQCDPNSNQNQNQNHIKSTSKDIRAPRFDAQAHLISIGVGESLADDWIKHRRAAKAPPSLTAIDGIAREADKAGISLSDALAMCCQRGWRGFKAEWVSIGVIPLSGLPPNGRRQRTDELRETASIILTGRTNDRQPTERDITAECHRVA